MRLIDADSLMERSGWYNLVNGKSIHGVEDYEIASEPTVEIAPVRHGRWKHLSGDEWFCTHCGFAISTGGSLDKPAKKHCEECGAKMDLEG